jgi:hypothetical protein
MNWDNIITGSGQRKDTSGFSDRGELLKKYPTAVVYAHRADWGENEDGDKDVNEERQFVELNATEEQDPPTSKIKTPLFEAKVFPDIYFFGFDLDDEEARGH